MLEFFEKHINTITQIIIYNRGENVYCLNKYNEI